MEKVFFPFCLLLTFNVPVFSQFSSISPFFPGPFLNTLVVFIVFIFLVSPYSIHSILSVLYFRHLSPTCHTLNLTTLNLSISYTKNNKIAYAVECVRMFDFVRGDVLALNKLCVCVYYYDG